LQARAEEVLAAMEAMAEAVLAGDHSIVQERQWLRDVPINMDNVLTVWRRYKLAAKIMKVDAFTGALRWLMARRFLPLNTSDLWSLTTCKWSFRAVLNCVTVEAYSIRTTKHSQTITNEGDVRLPGMLGLKIDSSSESATSDAALELKRMTDSLFTFIRGVDSGTFTMPRPIRDLVFNAAQSAVDWCNQSERSCDQLIERTEYLNDLMDRCMMKVTGAIRVETTQVSHLRRLDQAVGEAESCLAALSQLPTGQNT